jgi:hypothetical protein
MPETTVERTNEDGSVTLELQLEEEIVDMLLCIGVNQALRDFIEKEHEKTL